MAAEQEQQEPEKLTQELQEGKEAVGQHIHSIRVGTNIDPEKAWLYDLSEENFKKLTPEQQKEWRTFNEESFKKLPETIERIKNIIRECLDSIYSKDAIKTYQEAAEVLRQEKNLTEEEKSDLEYIENYLEGYEEYKKLSLEDVTESNALSEIIPSSQAIHFTQQVISYMSTWRDIKADKNTKIEVRIKGDVLKCTRSNNKGEITVLFDNITMIKGKNIKGFQKLFLFILKKCNDQNYQEDISFPLQELVDKKMYKSIPSARKGFKDNIEKIMAITMSGISRKGKKEIVEAGGKLIYNYIIKNNYVTVSINPKFNINFLAQYFTVIPEYSYSLKTAAFSLIYYIFYLARQNTIEIAQNECFNISLEAIRAYMSLPNTSETSNQTYLIKKPIEEAIEEIEQKNNDSNFTLTLYHYDYDKKTGKGKHIEDCENVEEWLNCYLEVGLHGDYAKYFLSIAQTTREKIEAGNKRRNKALQRVIEKQIEKAGTK